MPIETYTEYYIDLPRDRSEWKKYYIVSEYVSNKMELERGLRMHYYNLLDGHNTDNGNIRFSFISTDTLDDATRIGRLPWWGKRTEHAWWHFLAMTEVPICSCGVKHSWLGMAKVYGVSPRLTLFHELAKMPFKRAISHATDISHCCVCTPRRYNRLATDRGYVGLLRKFNMDRDIFGQRTCTCMGCL